MDINESTISSTVIGVETRTPPRDQESKAAVPTMHSQQDMAIRTHGKWRTKVAQDRRTARWAGGDKRPETRITSTGAKRAKGREMKTRSKEENAAHARAQRAKKRNASVPPVPPCPHCIAKDQEIARLTAQAQVDHVKGKAEDTSLYEGVMAAKVGRITRCDTGHTIGAAR